MTSGCQLKTVASLLFGLGGRADLTIDYVHYQVTTASLKRNNAARH
jgi:hypothetical protein